VTRHPIARRAVAGALLAAALAALPARAALFDDEEARKRVEATNQRITQVQRQLEDRIAAVEKEQKNQGLIELFRDVEQIKADIARLRGQVEVLTHELEQSQKRQRDLYVDLDSRLRKLESAPAGAAAAAAGARPPADASAEQKSYDTALEQFKAGNYPAAIAGFQAFVKAYPKSPLAPSAQYWVGNAQFAQKDFRGAIASQRQLIASYPDSQKVPDALLNIGSSQFELGDAAGARRTLQDLVARHPQSEAAAKARQRLAAR
jgi:tol-pal system protein YbgF